MSVLAKIKYHNYSRSGKFFLQRLFRGWDDSETWSLDCSLAKLILPRLKQFRDTTVAVPGEFNNLDQWLETLDKMIWAFEYVSSDRYFWNNKEDQERAQRGLDLFAKYYCSMWW